MMMTIKTQYQYHQCYHYDDDDVDDDDDDDADDDGADDENGEDDDDDAADDDDAGAEHEAADNMMIICFFLPGRFCSCPPLTPAHPSGHPHWVCARVSPGGRRHHLRGPRGTSGEAAPRSLGCSPRPTPIPMPRLPPPRPWTRRP